MGFNLKEKYGNGFVAIEMIAQSNLLSFSLLDVIFFLMISMLYGNRDAEVGCPRSISPDEIADTTT